MKHIQTSLLTAALLAASKDNTNSSKKTFGENNLNNESKIISISIPSNSLRLSQEFSIDSSHTSKNNNDIINGNNLNILSSSNSSISIPIEISNNSISLPKNSFKNKELLSNNKEPFLCTCHKYEKENQEQKQNFSNISEIDEKILNDDSISKFKSKPKVRSKSEPKTKIESEIEQKSNTNLSKMKKSHSFVPFFSFSSYLSSSKSSNNNSSSDSKNSKDKIGEEKSINNINTNNNTNIIDDDNNINNFPSKYFISIPNSKNKIEISHSLPDLVLDKPSTSTSNSFTLSSLKPISLTKSIPNSSSKLNNSSIIDDTNKNNNDGYNDKGKKLDLPKVTITKHSLSSQESLKFNEHLYDHSNEDNNNVFSDEETELIKPIICEHCGGIVKYPKQPLIFNDQSVNDDCNENDITTINTNDNGNIKYLLFVMKI
eukprot:jgi/Orpsp1_1/1179854/evm.model.c7180000071069.1